MKNFSYFFLLLFCFNIISFRCYLFTQAVGQIKILAAREPITKVLEKKDLPQKTRKKLLFVEKVREFSRHHIFLNVKDTYTYFSQLDRNVLAWNVIASEELKLKLKEWDFPIVGTVPYLGFFSLEDAKDKARELEKENWDVRINEVAGYSTLGWFDDPLISTQLSYSDWYIATLIIHECTHATVWFPNDAYFNESFASFVGRQGALEFFRKYYGKKKYFQILYKLERVKKKRKIYSKYTRKLQKVYHSKLSIEKKRLEKARLFKNLEKALIQKKFANNKISLNNVDLLSFSHYHSGGNYFSNAYQRCGYKWKCFFEKIKQLKGLDPQERRKVWRKITKLP